MNIDKVLRKNNIFRYATSELSQDAFICWLLSHATEECWDVDSNLRDCALSFLEKILECKNLVSKERVFVKNIVKQYKNIDVLFQVDQYYVIIEDKTFTDTHDNQVNRYKETLVAEGIEAEDIICVYYKIEDQPEPEKDIDVEFTRESLLGMFKPYKPLISNAIFTDYVEYLEWLEWETKSYERLKISEWNGRAYVGFFKHVCNTVLRAEWKSWGYVANPTGGFMGLWFGVLKEEDYLKLGFSKEYLSELYLQIEDNIIAVKYTIQRTDATDMNKVRDVRWKLYEYFHGQLGEQFLKKVFRPGEYMTIGYIEYNENNYVEKIDMMKNALYKLPLEFDKGIKHTS